MISSADLLKITTLIFDIDGTLTDGRISWDSSGGTVKFFNMQDLHWMKLALRAGLRVGVLSGRADAANRKMAAELQLTFAVLDAKDKLAAFENLLQEYTLVPEECLYAGDDVVDMPVLRRAGVGIAVAGAVPELDEVCDYRTRACGGCGAAAEIIRDVLKTKGLYDKIMERYRR